MDKNEAIKIVKSHYPANKQMLNEALEFLIPELTESEDERIRKWLVNELYKSVNSSINKGFDIDMGGKALAWLKKQGEQKPAEKVEPKFKIEKGKWYVCIKDLLDNYANKAFCEGDTYLSTQDGSLIPSNRNVPFEVVSQDTYFRDWTIQDAKDGDVLVDSLGNVCIYQEPSTKLMYHSYCYGSHKCFIDMGGSHEIVGSSPATKEQRDKLEKAMADAGYTFDFEKKELKKIENEIEIPFGAKDSELQEVTYYIPKGFYAEIDDDEVVIKKGEKPIAWSEEDDWKLFDILALLRGGENCHYNTPELFDWLKSLRPQKQWKPTEKHISYLEDAIGMYEPSEANHAVLEDLLDQLKAL